MTTIAAGTPGLAAERFAATNAVAERFFAARADDIARACETMAERFQRGGRLLACGDGAQRSDVAHVVVEFMHPVVVGKRALPALALPPVRGGGASAALDVLARKPDILLLLDAGSIDGDAARLLERARGRDLVTLALAGGAASAIPAATHAFVVPSDDPCIVQETHEMLYHVLWELVHVFLDHRAVAA